MSETHESLEEDSKQYDLAKTEPRTGLENKGYFTSGVQELLDKNKRAPDDLQVGLIALAFNKKEDEILEPFLHAVGLEVQEMNAQYEHAAFYNRNIVLARRISNESQNMEIANELSQRVSQHARDYQVPYQITHTLTDGAEPLETVLDRLVTRAQNSHA